MREIKFRGWSKKTQTMIDLRKITPLAMDVELLRLGAQGLFLPFDQDIILMQYTGLADKNGKDIYEGDICSAEGRMVYSHSQKAMVPGCYKVYWREDRWHLKDQNGEDYQSGDYYHSDEIDWSEIEIIGNIYENHDLLEKEHE